MDVFRRHYLTDWWPTPDPALQDFCRPAFYGARTEPYRLGVVENVNVYDANSLYPSVQSTIKLPDPRALTFDTSPSGFAVVDCFEGVAQAVIDVPEMYSPPLPQRSVGRLFFPTGRIAGCWPLVEIRHALASNARLVQLDWVFYSTRSFNPFADFLNALFDLRSTLRQAGDEKQRILKALLNAAYGRYGVHSDGRLTKLVAYDPDVPEDEYAGGEIKDYGGRLYVLHPVGWGHTPGYANVFFAANISAGARIRLHRDLLLSGEMTCYCDTDSVMTYGHLPTGSGLGEMRCEHEGIDALIAAPKEYQLTLHGREVVTHVKGVPLGLREAYMATGQVRFRSPVGIKEAMQSHHTAGEWLLRSKTRGTAVSKRKVTGSDPLSSQAYLTEPWDQAELRAALQAR